MPVPMLMEKKLGARLRHALSNLSSMRYRREKDSEPVVPSGGGWGREGVEVGSPCEGARA
jgi:hypothetical protein